MLAHLVIIHCETCREDGGVHAMHGGASEAILFCESGQWRGGGEGGDAEDEIVFCTDIFLERERTTIRINAFTGEVEIASSGHCVGEQRH